MAANTTVVFECTKCGAIENRHPVHALDRLTRCRLRPEPGCAAAPVARAAASTLGGFCARMAPCERSRWTTRWSRSGALEARFQRRSTSKHTNDDDLVGPFHDDRFARVA